MRLTVSPYAGCRARGPIVVGTAQDVVRAPAGQLAELGGLGELAKTDLKKLLPKSTLFLHMSDRGVRKGRGVARVEGIEPVPITQLPRLLKGTQVRVVPVFDPGAVVPVDRYEIPAPMRRVVLLRNPTDTFPFGSWPSRRLDLDHIRPYREDGGPGQTNMEGLQPLIRRGHRAKTHGKWQWEKHPQEGVVWRSPLGHGYWVLADGRALPLPDGLRDRPSRLIARAGQRAGSWSARHGRSLRRPASL